MSGTATLTPAIVVGALRYGETSRIVKLATRDLGVVSAIAKGVQRPRSRFGAALQLLAEGTAHLLPSRGDLGTLAAFDLHDLHRGLASSLDAFHAANALAELAVHFVPPTPHPELYQVIRHGLRTLEVAPPDAVDTVALAAIWQFVAELGFPPALGECAHCGADVSEGPAVFSVPQGGVLCSRCATGDGSSRLGAEDLASLGFFLSGEGDPPGLDPRHAAAHRRLLARWVARHLGEAELPAFGRWWHRG